MPPVSVSNRLCDTHGCCSATMCNQSISSTFVQEISWCVHMWVRCAANLVLQAHLWRPLLVLAALASCRRALALSREPCTRLLSYVLPDPSKCQLPS